VAAISIRDFSGAKVRKLVQFGILPVSENLSHIAKKHRQSVREKTFVAKKVKKQQQADKISLKR